MDDEIKKLKKSLITSKEVDTAPDWNNGLSTGSTLLNLAFSGRPDVGFIPGRYYYWVGDSGSGKTFCCMTCFAEAVKNPFFKEHRLIFDNAEMGADMDWSKFFGTTAAKKIEPPRGTRKNPKNSTYLEDFYFNVDDAFKDGRPFIYLLDSMDILAPRSSRKRFEQEQSARDSDKEQAGSYGTDKAKINSDKMRLLFNKLARERKSIVIVISQTRDNIGFGAKFNPKTRGGGHALTFYAGCEMWTSVKDHIKVKYAGKDVEKGIRMKVRIKKNRLSGRDRTVLVPILHDSGIDDLGSCVDYLVEWGHWKSTGKAKESGEVDTSKGKIIATEFDLELSRESLIQKIQENNEERELLLITAKVWAMIEKETELIRKVKYI